MQGRCNQSSSTRICTGRLSLFECASAFMEYAATFFDCGQEHIYSLKALSASHKIPNLKHGFKGYKRKLSD